MTLLKSEAIRSQEANVDIITGASQIFIDLILGKNNNRYESNKLFVCLKCGLSYQKVEWANKCEQWCRKNHTCNVEITKHAVNKYY